MILKYYHCSKSQDQRINNNDIQDKLDVCFQSPFLDSSGFEHQEKVKK
jgi:hypothetical protein